MHVDLKIRILYDEATISDKEMLLVELRENVDFAIQHGLISIDNQPVMVDDYSIEVGEVI